MREGGIEGRGGADKYLDRGMPYLRVLAGSGLDMIVGGWFCVGRTGLILARVEGVQ